MYPIELGITDMVMAALLINAIFLFSQCIFPPAPLLKIRCFWTNLMFIVALIIHIIPLLIVPVIIGIFWYLQTRKDKQNPSSGIKWDIQTKKQKIKGVKVLSFLAFFAIPLILLYYFPRNTWELFWWGLTVVCLYVRFVTEWSPLIRYSRALTRLQAKQEGASKSDVNIAIPSFWSLNITFFLIIIAISLRIYPVPFLLGYFTKYIIQRRYFNNFSDRVFYYRWKMKVNRGIVLRIFMLVSISTGIFTFISHFLY